ncbi:ABC transporter ATP-binding protein [Halovenus marina]|uniref:ABC transporter ATP-binding protein n=1 Tax=Halovenus marina TaxID=3396621 RepID=UPI003F56684A
MSGAPLLEVDGLKTQFDTEQGIVKAVDDVSFQIERGETYGIVGESGAGKSVTGLSILDLVESPGNIVSGEIRFKGQDLLSLSAEELRQIRGNEIAMIFQDPMTSLNPAFTVGSQIVDTIREHLDLSKSEARDRAITLLSDVGIPDAESRIDDYPHQFSGGMRQRAMIAMAISCDPDLIIADEPTTALDVTIQAQILELLSDLQEEYGLAIQVITHDMGVIAQTCDRVGVMYAGKLVEESETNELFESPRHPYTVGLMKAIPRLDDPRSRLQTIEGLMPDLIETPSGCSFHPRCPHATDECKEEEPPLETVNWESDHTSACIRTDEIDFEAETKLTAETDEHAEREPGEPILEATDVRKYFTPEASSWFKQRFDPEYVRAVDDVSLTINEGETLGLVGESGCGKTTLGHTLLQLYEPDDGTVLYAGSDLTKMRKRELRGYRSDLQIIFQDPFSSLNPRRTVRQIIGRPMEIHGTVDSDEEKDERIRELLEEVGLSKDHINRYPHEFSGGQKQRIGIARALAVEPDFIVADEPVSALDVSVQAKITNLLMDLQEEYNLTYLFIAHDLNVVQHISDRVAVMYLGEIAEIGTVDQIFQRPYHPYTEVLLSSIPRPDPTVDTDRITPEGEPPSPINPPSGCRFHTRCSYAMPECETQEPADVPVESGHEIHCHLFDDEIMADKDETERPQLDILESDD